jgi:hypothetical protein
MFSKINFTYKKPSQNSKNFLILKEQLVKQQIKENEKKSLINCISLQDKVDCNKIQNPTVTFEQSRENNIIDDNDHIVPFNVGIIHKKGIRIINNVYQSKYEYGKGNSTGLGDFLRGCYFILEFCEKYNFQPKIIFNNCISKFLLIKTHNLHLINNVLKGISFCKNNNFRDYVIENGIIQEPLKDTKNIMADFVDYIVKSPEYNGNVFMYCNSFPINEIPEKNKEYMRNLLEPSNEMKIIISQTLNELNIYSKQYIVIHIRAGDSYLTEDKNTFTSGYIYDLINNIKNDINGQNINGQNINGQNINGQNINGQNINGQNINGQNINGQNINGQNKYLLIADSNNVKKILQKYFPKFKTLMKPITHFGEGVILEEEKVKNTMLDFYLLSFAKSIFSYSTYKHGSGFSYWCAKTFNIPYVSKYIP